MILSRFKTSTFKTHVQMKATVSTDFVAAGCARGSGMMDWSHSGLLAYAAQQDVCLAREVLKVDRNLASVFFALELVGTNLSHATCVTITCHPLPLGRRGLPGAEDVLPS